MTTDALNEYIRHYLEEDNTHSAIMLTAPWGAGKSYYIKTGLVPFLEDKKLGYAIISLYGLKDLAEISKSIYLELRLNKHFRKTKKKRKAPNNRLSKWFRQHGKEVANSVVGVGKTIIKGVASIFNIDINFSDKDLQKIFESVDLTNKLIILEDLERSSIDIIEILGYVNNLVEQDGVKVLLVANEEEILKEEKQKTEDVELKKIVTLEDYDKKKELPKLKEDAKDYLHIKEKTISDTIYFETPIKDSFTQIMQSFSCEYFNQILLVTSDDDGKTIVDKICNLWKQEKQKCNLRSFIFACQKTKDILTYSNVKCDICFAEALFLDNVKFAIKFKGFDDVNWRQISYGTALRKFGSPYFYVNYEYIFDHKISQDQIIKAETEYLQSKKLREEQLKRDEDFQILTAFYYKTEQEVAQAVVNIRDRLKTNNSIPATTFGELANYLIAIKPLIQCDAIIEECKQFILKQLQSSYRDDIQLHITHHNGIELWDQSQKDEYGKFTNQMLAILNQQNTKSIEFHYSIDDISECGQRLWDYKNKHYDCRYPIISLDVNKIIELLKHCNAYNIQSLRTLLRENYALDQDMTKVNRTELIEIRDKLKQLLTYEKYDSIQKWQIKWIVNDFDKIINKSEN